MAILRTIKADRSARGMAMHQRLDIRSEALPVLRQLSERADTPCILASPGGRTSSPWKRSRAVTRSRCAPESGNACRRTTGIGKAILAFAGDADVAKVLEAGLEQRTVNVITDAGELRRELERIRVRAFSTDMEENEEGVRCVAAPVFDHRLNVAGAISIAGPAFRFSEVRISDLGNEVATAAQEVSRRLGCQVSTHAIPIDRRVVGRRSSHRAYANVGRGPGM